MKAVHFGAGNIGRGFIGLVLSQAGFEVCFVDIDDAMVAFLSEQNEYTVTLANETHDTLVVRGVTAIHGSHEDLVAQHIAQADIVTTAIGANNLRHIAKSLAQGITLRSQNAGGSLQVIACENGIGSSDCLKEFVYAHLSPEVQAYADRMISFPNAMVDRIVPNQKNAEPGAVLVEPFYEWVVERTPGNSQGADIQIEGVLYVDDLTPYLERKLFTVNTGHCAAAYLGYLRGYKTIQQALGDSQLKTDALHILGETGEVLVRKFGFDRSEHQAYIQTTIERFANPLLSDEITRIARSPIRKLSPDDRLVAPALQAHDLGVEPRYLALAIAAAFCFDYEDDEDAAAIQAAIASDGISSAIARFTSIPQEHPLHARIIVLYNVLRSRR